MVNGNAHVFFHISKLSTCSYWVSDEMRMLADTLYVMVSDVMRTIANSQLSNGQLLLRTTVNWDSFLLGQLPSRTTATQDNCHPGQLPPRTAAT